MHAVMKQDMLALVIDLSICPDISETLDGHTACQTPTAMARVDRLENPQMAYVVMAWERSWEIKQSTLQSPVFTVTCVYSLHLCLLFTVTRVYSDICLLFTVTCVYSLQ